jgi:Tat-targeted selenate reductase subunit YnfE
MSRRSEVDRRTFMKGAGTLGAMALAGESLETLPGIGRAGHEAFADDSESIIWTHCTVNCMSCCAWQCHVKDGEVVYIESDTTGDQEFGQPQMRACLRGRSARRWLQDDERLNYPMKRVGKRGEGKFERISWDEALDTIASELTRIRNAYGSEAVYIPQCSGVVGSISAFGSNPVTRLLNLTGGFLGKYGNYSSGLMMQGCKYTYGDTDCYGSNYWTLQHGELLVMFGNSPADTRMGGTGSANLLAYARQKKDVHVICIDPRMSDTAIADNTEWIPIRTGTDAALCSALAYEIISNGWADEEFLRTYCIGYDEQTLPLSAKGKNASYKDYILGTGYDMVPKTPAWASAITEIPESRIKELARQMHEANPLFIQQGYGPQRHSNGEMTSRAIMVLPQLLGQIGKPGMNDGRREGKIGFSMPTFPTGKNAVKTQIPTFLWTRAVDNPESMTSTNAGVTGSNGLSVGIKFIFNYAGNCLTNQHSDINRTHDILSDESKCEFIVTSEVFMTDSAKYSDILLPDLTSQEQVSIIGQPYGDNVKAVIFGQPVYEPKFERRGIYEVCCDLAKRLGVYDEYSGGGKTREDWNRDLYNQLRDKNPQLPTWEEGVEMGIYKEGRVGELVALKDFIADPEGHPLKTPSGKIEIYSEQLAKLRDTWELEEGDEILPIPAFSPGFQSYKDLTNEYPLLIQGFHYKAHVHSTYANNTIVQQAAHNVAWINPVDAEARGISTGDTVRVFNDRGALTIEARVTPRIIPGVVAMPQGAWHDADMEGDRVDRGGCINTITTQRPSPIAKGNPQHSNIGQVEKVG